MQLQEDECEDVRAVIEVFVWEKGVGRGDGV